MGWLARLIAWFRRPTPPTPPSRIERFDAAEVISIMNTERGAKLTRLRADPRLMSLAHDWAARMANTDTLAHGDLPPIVGGEVIAAGQGSSDAVVASWMGSPKHRAIILTAGYQFAGVGRAVSASGVPYWCADFA